MKYRIKITERNGVSHYTPQVLFRPYFLGLDININSCGRYTNNDCSVYLEAEALEIIQLHKRKSSKVITTYKYID